MNAEATRADIVSVSSNTGYGDSMDGFLKKCIVFSLVFIVSFSNGIFALDETVKDEYGISDKPVSDDSRPWPEGLDVFAAADIQQGYDNNVNLDPNRDKDGFSQTLFTGDVSYSMNDTFRVLAGGDLYSAIYYKFNKNNILDMAPFAGFEWDIFRWLTWENTVTMDYFSYPNSKESSFSSLELETKIRHDVMEGSYHEIYYRHIARYYPDKKVYLENNDMGNEDRSGIRNIIGHTARTFIFQSVLLKFSNEFQFNDSNYTYQQFYDYWAYRVKHSVMYFFTDKIYAYGNVIYRYKNYKDRRRTDDASKTLIDHSFIYNLSLYYDISDNVTFGVTYSYKENYPNDPFIKYSGSVITGGVYLTF